MATHQHAPTGSALEGNGQSSSDWERENFSTVIGQEDVITELVRACKQPPMHAWLITGPPGSGRSTVATSFAAALQATGPHCLEAAAVLEGHHPDVRTITPEGLSISVDEIREIISLAALKPAVGRWNIIIIEDADRLTEGASNALLKTIEEPATATIIMLCAPTADPADIAVTIKSRCRHIRLNTPESTHIATALVKEGISAEDSSWASQVCAGHIGRARRLATDEQARALRGFALGLPRAAVQSAQVFPAIDEFIATAEKAAAAISQKYNEEEMDAVLLSMGSGAGKVSTAAMRGTAGAIKTLERRQKMRATRVSRDMIDLGLIDLAGLLRDAMMRSFIPSGAALTVIHPDYEETITRMSAYIGPAAWLACIQAVFHAREEINHNVKPKIALSAMMARMHQELTKK